MISEEGGPQRPWRRLPAKLFAFTTTDSADLHLAVASVLTEAAAVQPALTFDDVRRGLITVGWDDELNDDEIQRTLEALVNWGHVEAAQSHSAVYATPEEFERRNLQYSITVHGQAAMTGVREALAALARSVSLQPAVIDAIAEGLVDLHRYLTTEPGRTNRIYTGLMAVENHHRNLVDNVRQFNTELQRLVGEDAIDDEVFLDVKQRTVAYLQEYVEGVEAPVARVALAIDRLVELGASRLFDAALIGANLAPLGETDPGPAWLAERAAQWAALRAWFRPENPARDEPSIGQITALAQGGIISLLRVLERRWEARRRSAAIDADFRRLADWFAVAPDEETAHGLFQAAFGLWPARHHHLLPDDHEAVAPGLGWSDSPAVPVSPTLRSSGTESATRGRVRAVGDPRVARARRQRHQAEALLRQTEIRAALLTDGVVPLAAFGMLAADEFAELLALLSRALAAPIAADGTRRSLSTDGRVEIVISNPVGEEPSTAELVTDAGRLVAPNLSVSIVLCGEFTPSAAEPIERPDASTEHRAKARIHG